MDNTTYNSGETAFGRKINRILNIIKQVLTLIGKPFYFIFALIILLVLFIIFPLGRAIVKGISIKLPVRIKLPHKPEIAKPHFRLPRPNFVIILFILWSVASIFIFWYTILSDLPSPR